MKGRHLGTVYLLCFERPYMHARHYRGFALDLDARLAQHEAGTGANLLRHVKAAGIGWTLARVWTNATRGRERQLKNQGGASRQCPICKAARDAAKRRQPRLFVVAGNDMRPVAVAS